MTLARLDVINKHGMPVPPEQCSLDAARARRRLRIQEGALQVVITPADFKHRIEVYRRPDVIYSDTGVITPQQATAISSDAPHPSPVAPVPLVAPEGRMVENVTRWACDEAAAKWAVVWGIGMVAGLLAVVFAAFYFFGSK